MRLYRILISYLLAISVYTATYVWLSRSAGSILLLLVMVGGRMCVSALCMAGGRGAVITAMGAAAGPKADSGYWRRLLSDFALFFAILIAQALVLQGLASVVGAAAAQEVPHWLLDSGYVLRIGLLLLLASDEELFFRGALATVCAAYDSRRALFVFLSALLFALYHVDMGALGTVHAAAAGIWLSLFYVRYRQIGAVVALHFLYNGVALLIG